MKNRFVWIIMLLFSCNLYCSVAWSQESSSATIKVVDSKTGEAIDSAIVELEQLPGIINRTDPNGITIFLGVPIGRIDVRVSSKGYIPEKNHYINVSQEEKNNYYEIRLNEIAGKKDYLIYGEVVFEDQDIPNAEIELKVLNEIYRISSDESGNYYLRIPKKKFEGVSEFTIEVKKEGCQKIRKTVLVPKSFNVKMDITFTDCPFLNISIEKLDSLSDMYKAMKMATLPFSMVASRQGKQNTRYMEQLRQFLDLTEYFGLEIEASVEELTPEYILTDIFSSLGTTVALNNNKEILEAYLLGRNFVELLVTWFFTDNSYDRSTFELMLKNYDNQLKDSKILSPELILEGRNILKTDFSPNIDEPFIIRSDKWYNLYNWQFDKVDPYIKKF